MNPILVPLAIAMAFGGMFVANEWSHGAMSEIMGVGHHHALDYGGYHCAGHNDTLHGQHHQAHMHGNQSMPHGGCPGGVGMHGQGGRMGR